MLIPCACLFIQVEDEEWLNRHPRYGLTGPPSERGKINEDGLEEMMGILERATGTADCVPLAQAETLFVSKLGMSKVNRSSRWMTTPAPAAAVIALVVAVPSELCCTGSKFFRGKGGGVEFLALKCQW